MYCLSSYQKPKGQADRAPIICNAAWLCLVYVYLSLIVYHIIDQSAHLARDISIIHTVYFRGAVIISYKGFDFVNDIFILFRMLNIVL